ncbi:plasmid segregation protein ParM [Neobacillus pocheonensis]|uniref:Plasmid segregation protein ParM n=1 Tax=Neobacillus pocheonensis TaxID=363869 RepID=A0ABT0WI00_9BACI|nr:plasmid segregation protein ParM [Neobacillus pocheonensis]
MANILTVGIDFGNSFVKAVTKDRKFVLPNFFARASEFKTDLDYIDNTGLDTYTCSEYPDEQYVWGERVYESQRPLSTFTSEDRYTQKNYIIMVEMILAKVFEGKGKRIDVFVVTGVPAEEKETIWEADIIKAFTGSHEIIMNGKKIRINVVATKVLAQPIGDYMNTFLDDFGRKKDPSIKDKYIGIIDIGGGTTDLDGVYKGRPSLQMDRYTIRVGSRKAYEEIVRYIKKLYPSCRKATIENVEKALHDNTDTFWVNASTPVDLKQIKDEAYKNLADEIISDINSYWDDRMKFDEIHLIGGSADLVAKHLKKVYGNRISFFDESQLINANGFYKYSIIARNLMMKEMTTEK